MFKVGITRDFLTQEGNLTYKDMGLDILEKAEGIVYEFMEENQSPVTPDMLKGYDAVISLSPAYNKDSFKGVTQLKAICRFGVGYDMVDLNACNEANVLVTITRGAVNHSVAESVITWMLALTHRVFEKDRLVRTGKWDERSMYTGTELRKRTLGIIGLGGIGGKLVQMLNAFDMNPPVAYDPFADPVKAEAYGVKLVDLDTLMRQSDFVSVNCPLTEETRNLISTHELSLLKKNAYIINTARGGIINEEALIKILVSKSIAGYATDVYEKEPPDEDHPLFKLDNVMLAPHCIAWTDELFREIGHMACQQVLQIAQGKIPDHVINSEILDHWHNAKK
ncbi:NAD(P)-dependent oxidoreductase [Agriterribacter humi]|uniref:NAD(P)-dependent oxidoreductase n=1 Tax=Agriterribacter humi TaxID=1104781 RepID=UPI001265802C|nr:NAD(P)-dependent oxidoreductase [Agriterribacter humi]